MKIFVLLSLFFVGAFATATLNATEAEQKFNWAQNFFQHRQIHTLPAIASRGVSNSHLDALYNEGMMEIPSHSIYNTNTCPPSNALRTYQDRQRAINRRHEARTRHFWELQADYNECRRVWGELLNGNYDALPFVSPRIGGVAHPADWMASSNKTLADGTIRPMGIVNVFGYSHATYCALHPEKQVAPGFIRATYINQMVCNGGFCHFDVTSETSTFEQVLPDGTVVPAFIANLTTIGWVGFDDQDRIDSIEVDVKGISRLDFISPQLPTPFSITRDQATSAACFLTTGLLCITPSTVQFHASIYDPPTAPPGFADCYGYMYSLPLGSLGSAYWKTMQCKYTHTVLAADADMHCAHIGRSGGGQCRDRYDSNGGLDVNGLPDLTQSIDPHGIHYGPNYIEAHSLYFQNRAFDSREPLMEECLDRRTD